MKRGIAVLGLSAWVAAGAQAQAPAPTSVTLYGLIDTGVERITNVGVGHQSLSRMLGFTATLPSRWGLRGSEDLGAGLRAVFTLESGFLPDTGGSSQGGRLFGRQAFVGLSGDWGTVSLGRQYTMMFWSMLDGDLLGANNYGIGSLDSYYPNTRTDNAMAYRGAFNGVTVGATYSFGRDTVSAGPSAGGTNCAGENAADKQACREWSAMVKYDSQRWGAALAVDEIRGGAGAFANLVRSDLKDRRAILNGYVRLGDSLKLNAGVIRRDNDAAGAASATNGATPRSNLLWLGAAYTFTPSLILDAQVQRLDFKEGGDKATLSALRATYLLSKRTAAYVSAGHLSNGARLSYSIASGQGGGNPVPGGSQNGVMVGIRHAF